MKSVENEILRFRSTCCEVAKGKGNVVTLRLSLNCCIKIRNIFTASCQHMTHARRHIKLANQRLTGLLTGTNAQGYY